MARIMRSRVKDSIFREEVVTHQQLVRQKLNYEIIKDNYRNKITQKIIEDFTNEEDTKMRTIDYKYARIQKILDA